jgi:hypothetical protein
MAILIFIKNSSEFYRIAENQEVLDNNKNFSDSEYDLVTVSQEDFDGLRLNKKTIINRVENTVTLEDTLVSFTESAKMQENINSIISVIDSYLISNLNKPMASDIITYKNYIQTIDPKTLITDEDFSKTPPTPPIPLNMSVEEYAENQGIKAINTLQLL